MRRVGHRPDGRVPFLVADCNALVLAEVFRPGGDDELLKDPSRRGAVLPRPPGTRPGAAPAEPRVAQRRQQVGVAAGHCEVLDAYHDRPVWRSVPGQARLRPVISGHEFFRADRPEPVTQPGERAERQPRSCRQQCRRQPGVLGGDAHDGAADGIAALEEDQVERHAAGLDPLRER